MKLKMFCASAILLLAAAAFTESFPVVKDGKSLCKFHTGTGVYDSFAKEEFLDLMRTVTGAGGEFEPGVAGAKPCKVYIGSCKDRKSTRLNSSHLP